MRSMRPEIEAVMENWGAGDRVDAVAQVCRRLYLRTTLCPCTHDAARFPNGCRQCQLDKQQIEEAWDSAQSECGGVKNVL